MVHKSLVFMAVDICTCLNIVDTFVNLRVLARAQFFFEATGTEMYAWFLSHSTLVNVWSESLRGKPTLNDSLNAGSWTRRMPEYLRVVAVTGGMITAIGSSYNV